MGRGGLVRAGLGGAAPQARPRPSRRRRSIGRISSSRTSCRICRSPTPSSRRCARPTERAPTSRCPFLEQGHLGEDWTTAKGDAALGEPVYSVADGWVAVAHDFANAWGKVIFIDYRLPAGRYPPFVEVMYAQLQTMDVTSGDFVKAGQKIGTVGNAGGIYKAHLHWEVRQTVGLGLGLGFSDNRDGWLGPSEFLEAHRGDRTGKPLLDKVLAPSTD